MDESLLGLDAIFKLPTHLQEGIEKAIWEITDKQSTALMEELKKRCPRKTDHLYNSITKEKVDKMGLHGREIGYRVFFDGNRPDSEKSAHRKHASANQVVANSLNTGFVDDNFIIHGPNYFIRNSLHVLKGTDQLISKRFDEILDELEDFE